MRGIIILYLYFFALQNGIAQNFNNYYRKGNSFFPEVTKYKPWGWFISPGLTYMFPKPGSHDKTLQNQTYTFNAKGSLGLYLDAGMYKLFKYPGLFRYMDFGVAYKSLRGKEHFESELTHGQGSFKDQYILGFFNLHNVIELSNPWFIQNSLGVNADYRFSQQYSPSSGISETVPNGNIEVNIHYKFSVGLLASKKFMIIPSVETPLIGLLFNTPWSVHPYFNSWYQPIIFSVRFMWLREAKDECPPVFAPGMIDGMRPDGFNK